MIFGTRKIFYPFFENMNRTQQHVYAELVEGVRKLEKTIQLKTECSPEDVRVAVHGLYRDHPEIFWIDGSHSLMHRANVVVTVDMGYNGLVDNILQRQKQLQAVVDSYLRLAAGKNPLEQERIIHDKMIKDISYEYGPYDQTVYAALVQGKAVCAGYAKSFQYLMQQLQIPCYSCSGEGKGKNKQNSQSWESHAWNIIQLGNDFYNIDITWDDCYDSSSNKCSYTYYNCTDAQIAGNHRRDPEFMFLPKCNATKYSFENLYGVTSELEGVLQDGVTHKTVVHSKETFLRVVNEVFRQSRSDRMNISFPVQGKTVIDNSGTWIEEAIRSAYGPYVGWSVQRNMTDYHNGYFRLEMQLTINH